MGTPAPRSRAEQRGDRDAGEDVWALCNRGPGLNGYAALRQKGGAKERMRIERNQQVSGTSQSDEPSNTDSPPAAETKNRARSVNDEAQPLTEHLLAGQFLTDAAVVEALTTQLVPSLEGRDQRIAALQNAIAEGTFEVSAEQIAEAMLSEQQVRDGTAA
jgi:anti-sigma28 factor (negative regulator of flagellin synthesis)